jgi:pilus assembly protein CpaC
MFPRKFLLAFALALVAPCAAFAATARPVLDEANAKIMTISTKGAAHQRLTLSLDKAAVVQLDADARDVLVSNPELVDAVVRTPRRIFLLATKVGQTNAFFFDAQGKQILALDIRVEKDVVDLSGLMKMAMPNSAIQVQAMNDNIVLTGSVSSALESSRAADLAARFTGDAKKVVNMINIAGGQQVMLKVRIAEMNRNVAKQFGIDLTTAAKAAGIPGVISTSNPFGLVGKALSDLSGGQVGQVCPGQFFPNTTSSIASSASSMLTGAAGVVGSLGGSLPLNGTTTAGSMQTVINPITGLPMVTGNVTSNAVPGIFSGASSVSANAGQNLATSSGTNSASNTSIPCSSANNAQGTLKALEQVGLVHMLAEPNLTAVSGETAKFLAGGEFPVPVSRDRDGNVTVEFKTFGVGLSFTPVVLAPGRISLQLSSEVSELTNAGSFIAGSGTNTLAIPALAVRRTATTVELPSGGSFAVAGLMQHNTKQVIDGFPGVKDLPVLGALFRSRDFSDNQTELVVLISAYLVEPNAESAFSAPTDGFVAPTDPETLLLGRLNATYKKKDEKPVASQASAPVGFVVR